MCKAIGSCTAGISKMPVHTFAWNKGVTSNVVLKLCDYFIMHIILTLAVSFSKQGACWPLAGEWYTYYWPLIYGLISYHLLSFSMWSVNSTILFGLHFICTTSESTLPNGKKQCHSVSAPAIIRMWEKKRRKNWKDEQMKAAVKAVEEGRSGILSCYNAWHS